MRNRKTWIFFYPFYFQHTLHQQHNSTAFAIILIHTTPLIKLADVPKMERESWIKRQMLTMPHYYCKFTGTYGSQKPRSQGSWILEVFPLKPGHWQQTFGIWKNLQCTGKLFYIRLLFQMFFQPSPNTPASSGIVR